MCRNIGKEPKGWYSRGRLPHFDGGAIPQAITFRLADSIPLQRLEVWREELRLLGRRPADAALRRRVEAYLDQGHGAAWLADPRIAALVERALLHFDGERYLLHAWVVMPNHVHVLVTPRLGHRLPDIVHTWKSFTARQANRLLNRTGAFWQDEYFDRFIRDERHFEAALSYVEANPVRAGLCASPEDWRYSSAWWKRAGEDARAPGP